MVTHRVELRRVGNLNMSLFESWGEILWREVASVLSMNVQMEGLSRAERESGCNPFRVSLNLEASWISHLYQDTFLTTKPKTPIGEW